MNSQSIAVAQPIVLETPPHAAHHGGRRGLRSFVGHFAQMVVAMAAGMALLAGLLGDADISVELYALSMTASMTAPMVAWMRFRGHSWRASAEMTAAMVVPVAALLPLFLAGLISDDALIGLEHVAMLPSMLTVMIYRRREYGL